ncbi:SDR family NAD(P)-dependent oxidoreductase [Agitococcus lubricus]|uniref:NADP-dependent 3-hydroxy acid dehydrogenase YdfG n=1 Tax=Agitococcus lubricus TaxID=1077255 RepID=A0A2T5IYM8_9GAMM|nr:SDR family oxidoreductase [Agitococcus lubricus]PTQ89037.1 NADP-dependent 3-hydroxy acid dehydrogenase YdfG [Agitococcus lubricus]
MNLKDKIVVITGAGSGMGRAYAKVYAEAGAHLALNDYNASALAETVALYGNPQTISCSFDVADRSAMFAFAEQVLKTFGRVDIVINNAGILGGFKPVWELTPSEFERTLSINLGGVVNGTQAFLPAMLKAQSGQIVNVSSIFGLIGAPNHGDYSASKFAVRGFTEALMTELQETGVTAHLVHPGGIATDICKINGEEQAFSKHYLKTSAEDIAYHVRTKLSKGSAKIVYGKDSLKTWLASNFMPLKWLAKLVWFDIKPVLDPSPYNKVRR